MHADLAAGCAVIGVLLDVAELEAVVESWAGSWTRSGEVPPVAAPCQTECAGWVTLFFFASACFVLFCFPCSSRCACGGMTTAGTTFPPSNLGWFWPTCSPFVERGALCTECRSRQKDGRRARALLTPYIEGDQLRLIGRSPVHPRPPQSRHTVEVSASLGPQTDARIHFRCPVVGASHRCTSVGPIK